MTETFMRCRSILKMKFLQIILLALTVFGANAQSFVISAYTGTNNPSDGHTLTVSGDTRTFKTTVTSSATQIQIGVDLATTMANTEIAFGGTPVAQAGFIRNGVNMTFIGTPNVAYGASLIGNWGTLVNVTNSAVSALFAVPLSLNTNVGTRLTNANNLILSLQYGTTQIPTTYPAFTNFINRITAQDISAPLHFNGALILSNATQKITLGTMDNVTLTNIPRADFSTQYVNKQINITNADLVTPIALGISGFSPVIRFWNTLQGADEKAWILGPTGSSGNAFDLLLVDDTGSPTDIAFSITRSGTTAYQMELYPTVILHGGIDGTLGGVLTNVALTNATVGAKSVYVAGSIAVTNGTVGIASSGAALALTNTAGTADDKTFRLVHTSDSLNFNFYNDAGALISTPLSIPHAAALPTLFSFSGALAGFDTGIDVEQLATFENNASFGGVVTNKDISDPGANPTSGIASFSVSGIPYMRSAPLGLVNVINRSAFVHGSGTDYNFTSSTAQVIFGTQSPTFTAPATGFYSIDFCVAVSTGGTDYDDYQFKLRNSTTATDISGSDQEISSWPQAKYAQVTGNVKCSLSSGDIVQIFAFNSTAARGTIKSARTRISYTLLY